MNNQQQEDELRQLAQQQAEVLRLQKLNAETGPEGMRKAISIILELALTQAQTSGDTAIPIYGDIRIGKPHDS